MIGIAHHPLERVPIADLRPTQVTVGMREVDCKRARWRKKYSGEAARYLNTHRFPVVLGPDSNHYLMDRHHHALALRDEGICELPVSIVVDMSGVGLEEFWTTLEGRNWAYPFDDEGRRCSYGDMPTSVDDLIDDSFRSLAGALRRAGGYAKDKAPFSEFRWADYLRCRIPRKLVEHHFGRALALAMNLAQSREAAMLPGWRRHSEEIPCEQIDGNPPRVPKDRAACANQVSRHWASNSRPCP